MPCHSPHGAQGRGTGSILASGRVVTPDLLHESPRERIPLAEVRLAMSLAFASGVSGGLFSDALDRASVAPSTWQPSSFAGDLFLTQLVTLGFRVRTPAGDLPVATAHLVNVLAHPPSDPATIRHRRTITAELLGRPELRKELSLLYESLARFRARLEGAQGSDRWDSSRRQLDVLATFKEIIDRAADGFADARSGLGVLTRFGREVRGGEAFRALEDLLRHDDRLATVRIELTVGADGRIRTFSLLSVTEEVNNPFHRTPTLRWLAKAELFARGYRFDDVEVLVRLLDAVFEGVVDDAARLVQLMGDLEVYLGALGLHDTARDAGLPVCLPEIVLPDEPRSLEGLWNPLLLLHGKGPVPCDLSTDRHDATVLVTGPNSGGKTRLLQSVALAQLLAQSGLFVPARSARLALAPGLVVSFIEETTADQAEGRLGMELVRIRRLFERLPPGAMVILDELCSGTNPQEGEEIFELVVRMLARLHPQAFITTHFLAFAGRLEHERAIEELRFLQVELGSDHRPTFQFAPGVARTSMARHTAARLGVTGEQLLALVEQSASRALH